VSVSLDDFVTLFSLASRAARGRAERILNSFGLHVGQQFVLYCLWQEDGLTPSEIAARVRVETATATRAIQRMEQAGIVARIADEHDGRRVRIFLTPRGNELREQVPRAMRQLEADLLGAFSPAERAELMRLLRTLYQAAAEADRD
jgi:MarR family transcriptional regulator, organic hydroperoxide resistance regulator